MKKLENILFNLDWDDRITNQGTKEERNWEPVASEKPVAKRWSANAEIKVWITERVWYKKIYINLPT